MQDMADLFEFKEISKHSKATQKEINLLVEGSKEGRLEKSKTGLGI